MQLTHIAIWTNELARSRDFYVKYFGGKSNEKYVNPKKGFASYFVTFEGAVSLEIMQRTDITVENDGVYIGLAHFAFSAGSKEGVDQKIEQFRRDGYTILGEPRTTGDGFYEGSVADPDGNIIEIVELLATSPREKLIIITFIETLRFCFNSIEALSPKTFILPK